MYEYDEECLQVFLDQQGKLFDEPVAGTPEEAEAFLEDCMAVVVDSIQEVESYFQEEADRITTGVLIVDIRHKPTANDLVMHDWFRQTGCPEIVVANKLDKLKKSEIEPNLRRIRETLELTEADALVPFSAEKGDGKQELLDLILGKVKG